MAYPNKVGQEKLSLMMGFSTFQRMSRFREPSTVSRYAADLYRVMIKTGLNPDQLVEYAKGTDETGIGDLKVKVTEGYTSGMQYLISNDMNRLLKSNGVKDLPEEKNQYIPKEDHEAYSKQDIRRLLEYVNFLKGKLIVTIAAESGLRIHHILALKWKHVQEDYQKGKTPLYVHFSPEERKKAKSSGYAFLGPGSLQLLKSLVEKGEIKRDPEAFLFESSYASRASEKREKLDRKGKAISYITVYGIVQLARKKSKIQETIQPFHGLRAYYANQLVKAGVPEAIRKRLMGHSLGSASAYISKDVEELRTWYSKAYAYLNLETEKLDPEALAENQNEIRDLKAKLKAKDEENLSIQSRLTRIEAVLSRMEEMPVPGSKEKKAAKEDSNKKQEGPKYVAKSEDLDSLIKKLEESSPRRTGKK